MDWSGWIAGAPNPAKMHALRQLVHQNRIPSESNMDDDTSDEDEVVPLLANNPLAEIVNVSDNSDDEGMPYLV
jgi:hypothetical protein